MTLFDATPPIEASAVLSADGAYRYELRRRWDPGPEAVWVMLNPSTADAEVDDPTIRRVIGFSRGWGFGGVLVVNLFALRSTNPDALLSPLRDPVGPENDRTLLRAFLTAHTVVGAWGAHPAAPPRARYVADHIAALAGRRRINCLAVTKDGAPRHPLYMPASASLEVWSKA